MSFFNYIRDQRVVIWRGIQNMNTTNLLNFLAKEGVTNVCQVKQFLKKIVSISVIIFFAVFLQISITKLYSSHFSRTNSYVCFGLTQQPSSRSR